MYLRDPASGLVGELARVVVEELVPEAFVRWEEPLAVVTGDVGAALTRLAPLPLLGLRRRCRWRHVVVVQEELPLELAFEGRGIRRSTG
jgi:hypothetical protein